MERVPKSTASGVPETPGAQEPPSSLREVLSYDTLPLLLSPGPCILIPVWAKTHWGNSRLEPSGLLTLT